MNDDLLMKRIKEFEKQYNTKMNKVIYRSKTNGWDNSSIEFKSQRIRKIYTFTEDPLMDLYINNFILRESCYNCPAKGLNNNLADIVLGDYWGIYHVHRDLFDNLGVSAVIVKTEKGQELFNKIKEQLNYKSTKYTDIIKYNPSFVASSERPELRDKIFKDIKYNELSLIAKLCKLNQEIVNNKKHNNELVSKEELQKVLVEKNAIQEQLNQIYNSKRFQFADKLGNVINKIKHIK